ncbi:hypothetical protein ASF10_23725 [Flavobacterium sp. Leaf82]|nr:hypothetical protein ASF10_23725 [Flavobacterium sp. Leaf82]
MFSTWRVNNFTNYIVLFQSVYFSSFYSRKISLTILQLWDNLKRNQNQSGNNFSDSNLSIFLFSKENHQSEIKSTDSVFFTMSVSNPLHLTTIHIKNQTIKPFMQTLRM